MPKLILSLPEDQKFGCQCSCVLNSWLQSVMRVNGCDLSWNILAYVLWLCWALLGPVQSLSCPFCICQETGFWFVLHHVPTGPSAGMYSPGYSEHMPMGRFSNNRAHSNYRVSLHATGALPWEQTPSPAPAPRACKPLMLSVLSVPLGAPTRLFVSADKAARGLARQRSEPGSTCSAWLWASTAALPSAQAASLPLCS